MWMNSRRSPRVVLQGAWACRLTDLGAVPDLQAAASGLLEVTCYHVHRCTKSSATDSHARVKRPRWSSDDVQVWP